MFESRFAVDGRSTSAYGAPALRGGPSGIAKALFIRLMDAFAVWHERADARRRLGSFDDRMLSDIGIDRATAEHEAAKPFWRT